MPIESNKMWRRVMVCAAFALVIASTAIRNSSFVLTQKFPQTSTIRVDYQLQPVSVVAEYSSEVKPNQQQQLESVMEYSPENEETIRPTTRGCRAVLAKSRDLAYYVI